MQSLHLDRWGDTFLHRNVNLSMLDNRLDLHREAAPLLTAHEIACDYRSETLFFSRTSPAGVAKLADAPDLGSGSARSRGSSPLPGTYERSWNRRGNKP